MTLKDIRCGSAATVIKLNGEGALRRRIMDMGTMAIKCKTVNRSKLKEYNIYSGLGGGFGGASYQYTTLCESAEDAEISQAKGPGSVNRLAALLSGSGMNGTDGGMRRYELPGV